MAACGPAVATNPAEAGIPDGVQLAIPFPRGPRATVTELGTLGIGYCFGAMPQIPTAQVCHVAGAYRDDYNLIVARTPVHDLGWFQAHHPDWLVYKADRITPAGVGDPEAEGPTGVIVVMDISHPAVQQYQFDYFLRSYLEAGWTRVGFDNVGLGNPNAWSGVYRHGQWVQLYSGRPYDSAILQTWTDWAKAMHTKVKAFRSWAQLDANYSVPLNNTQNFHLLLPYIDGYFDEQGFTGGGGGFVSGTDWLAVFRAQQLLRAMGKLVFINGEVPIGDPGTPAAGNGALTALAMSLERTVPQAQMLWVVANYLLVKGKDYFAWESGYFARGSFSYQNDNHFIYRPQYYLPVGHPVGEPRLWRGVYRRDYSGGVVLVNPSAADTAVLHVGSRLHPLHTPDGLRAGELRMPPVSGMVLTDTVPHIPQVGAGGAVLPPHFRVPSSTSS